jgi:hypothetical protein
MDGWMDRHVNEMGCVDGLMDGWIDGWIIWIDGMMSLQT